MHEVEARIIVAGKALVDAMKAESGIRDATPLLDEFHKELALTTDPQDLVKVIAYEGSQYLYFFDTASAVFDRFLELDHRTSFVLRWYANHVNYWRSRIYPNLSNALYAEAEAWDALNPRDS